MQNDSIFHSRYGEMAGKNIFEDKRKRKRCSKILLCRPREKCALLQRELESFFREVWVFSPYTFELFASSLPSLEKFTSWIFSSELGVKFFFQLCGPKGIVLPTSVSVAVVGEKTRQAVEHYFPQYSVVFVGRNIRQVLEYFSGISYEGILHFTSFQSLEKWGKLDFPGLRQYPIYRTVEEVPHPAQLQALRERPPDAILFGSPSCFDVFCRYFERSYLNERVILTLGESTERYLRGRGVAVDYACCSPEAASVAAELREVLG
ncbi:MAG: uroporphyrinogen-III synthase [Planctomycetota bacterium]|nr:MAG: uroporphyrinogen-III synthase [Planctomycetota bacterium]